MYSLGLVGNCQISGLISLNGSIDWLCLPRPDSEPIFGKLLDPNGGNFSISLVDSGLVTHRQYYLDNTNILVTEAESPRGGGYRITDFCPRFEQYGRMFRPLSLIRIVEPLQSGAQIQVDFSPVRGWRREKANLIRQNSSLRCDYESDSLRLTTNMPLTYLTESTPFHLKEKIYFALNWGDSVEEDLGAMCERFLVETRNYWRTWVKHCSIPSLFQSEVIRSALALKLHCFEDTGAILAATTTSLPEEIDGTRNWDYRFCWLRDSYFTLSALHNLGHFEEMENFLKFLLDIVSQNEMSKERLAPVYTLSRQLPLPEHIHSNWRGFENSGPVRTNNQAAEHIQNDVYGEMILTLAPIYFDERFRHLRGPDYQHLMEYLGRLCARSIGQRDAGLWEFRNILGEHSFTNLMLWAGLERLERIQRKGFLPHLSIDLGNECKRAEQAVRRSVKDGIVRGTTEDLYLDSALSLLSLVRFPDRDLAEKTLLKLRTDLAVHQDAPAFFYRYRREDDFGIPKSAFVVSSFWIAQAMAYLGQVEGARAIVEAVSKSANYLGLFSEHYDPIKKLQLGNFPQAYSHVGLINAAFAVSPNWNEVL